MSSLETFAGHCRQMAIAEHKPECHALRPSSSRSLSWEAHVSPNPDCAGCNPTKDRALFALLAAEVDDYLAPTEDLFGNLNHEPMSEDQ